MRASVPFLVLLLLCKIWMSMIKWTACVISGFVIGVVIQCSRKLTLNVPFRLSAASHSSNYPSFITCIYYLWNIFTCNITHIRLIVHSCTFNVMSILIWSSQHYLPLKFYSTPVSPAGNVISPIMAFSPSPALFWALLSSRPYKTQL